LVKKRAMFRVSTLVTLEHSLINRCVSWSEETHGGNDMTDKVTQFKHRSNEEQHGVFKRSGRFYCRDGSWFFKTREAINYGPYESKTECRYAYNEFIEVVSDTSDLPLQSESFDYQDTNSNWQPPKINFS